MVWRDGKLQISGNPTSTTTLKAQESVFGNGDFENAVSRKFVVNIEGNNACNLPQAASDVSYIEFANAGPGFRPDFFRFG